jgi:hypothetical protein
MTSRATYTATDSASKTYTKHLRTAAWQVVVTHYTGAKGHRPKNDLWCVSPTDAAAAVAARNGPPTWKWPFSSVETVAAVKGGPAMVDFKGGEVLEADAVNKTTNKQQTAKKHR